MLLAASCDSELAVKSGPLSWRSPQVPKNVEKCCHESEALLKAGIN